MINPERENALREQFGQQSRMAVVPPIAQSFAPPPKPTVEDPPIEEWTNTNEYNFLRRIYSHYGIEALKRQRDLIIGYYRRYDPPCNHDRIAAFVTLLYQRYLEQEQREEIQFGKRGEL